MKKIYITLEAWKTNRFYHGVTNPVLSMVVECLGKINGERLIVLNPYPACESVQHHTFYRKALILKKKDYEKQDQESKKQ